jgi:hypothetical protein
MREMKSGRREVTCDYDPRDVANTELSGKEVDEAT